MGLSTFLDTSILKGPDRLHFRVKIYEESSVDGLNSFYRSPCAVSQIISTGTNNFNLAPAYSE